MKLSTTGRTPLVAFHPLHTYTQLSRSRTCDLLRFRTNSETNEL